MRPLFELQPLAALDVNDIRHHNSGTDMASSSSSSSKWSREIAMSVPERW